MQLETTKEEEPVKTYETPEKLLLAVKRYIRGISRTVEVTEEVPTGRMDKYGHPVTEPQTVYNDGGKPIKQRQFIVPPSLQDLWLALDIDREAWEWFEAREEYKAPVAYARTVCEAWLVEQLVTRPKGVEGVKFALTHNFGWSEKAEVSLSEGGIERFLESLEQGEEF